MNEILSEEEILKLFKCSQKTLDELRLLNGLPYIEVHRRGRVYFQSEIIGWLLKKREENLEVIEAKKKRDNRLQGLST